MCLVLSRVRLSVTQCPVAHQAPLSIGILQARVLEWVAIYLLQGIFPMQGSNPGLPHCRKIFFYCLSHRESPGNLLKPDSSESMMTLSHFCASYEKRHRLPLLSIIIQGQVYSKQPWNIQCFSQRKSQVHSQLC